MKKIFISVVLLCLTMLSVVGCSVNVNDNKIETTKKSMETEENTEEPTTDDNTYLSIETTTVLESNARDNLTELYSDDNIILYYSGTDSRASGNYIQFWVENKSEQTYTILGDNITIDGVCYNDIICVGDITSNSSGEIDCNVRSWQITSPSTIGFEMDYYIDNVGLDKMNRKHVQIKNTEV